MFAWKECPVCISAFTVVLQEIPLQRQGTTVPQFYCMSCESFFHESGYREDPGQYEGDAKWLCSHEDNHRGIIEFLRARPHIRRLYEAGCGVGSLLSQLACAGLEVAGVDVNPVAVQYARSKGMNVRCGYFERLFNPVDAIIAIDVMEHLAQPRAFFSDLLASVKPGGFIFIRVPVVDRAAWRWLKDMDKDRPFDVDDPFRDNSVHITHFSSIGLKLMCEGIGAQFNQGMGAGLQIYRRKDVALDVTAQKNSLAQPVAHTKAN